MFAPPVASMWAATDVAVHGTSSLPIYNDQAFVGDRLYGHSLTIDVSEPRNATRSGVTRLTYGSDI